MIIRRICVRDWLGQLRVALQVLGIDDCVTQQQHESLEQLILSLRLSCLATLWFVVESDALS